MEIVDNSAVRIQCPSRVAKMIESYIEKSEVLDTTDNVSDVIVYWGLDEMQRLARIFPSNAKVPSPMSEITSGLGCLSHSIIRETLHGFYQFIVVHSVSMKQAQAKHLRLYGRQIT